MLSIIIIAYNEEEHLPLLLESLAEQTIQNFEVIVVDSNSIDKTATIAHNYSSRFTEFTYNKLSAPLGPGYARNCGAELCKYERILFLDADTILPSRFIEQVIHDISKKTIDVATCRIRISEGDILSNAAALFLNFFMIALYPFYSSGYGACLLSSKQVHQTIGGFREDLGICEDCDYIKRARRDFNFKFHILNPIFFTSNRRSKTENGFSMMIKYIKVHVYRMITKKEILQGNITYTYGNFNV